MILLIWLKKRVDLWHVFSFGEQVGDDMKKETWKKRIRDAATDAGTYRPCFDEVINTLAAILEKRDEAEKSYQESGEGPIVDYTNKGGSTNKTKNPALALWDDLNKTALAYWRELGLTPAGLKKLKDDALKEKNHTSFSDLLSKLDG